MMKARGPISSSAIGPHQEVELVDGNGFPGHREAHGLGRGGVLKLERPTWLQHLEREVVTHLRPVVLNRHVGVCGYGRRGIERLKLPWPRRIAGDARRDQAAGS